MRLSHLEQAWREKEGGFERLQRWRLFIGAVVKIKTALLVAVVFSGCVTSSDPQPFTKANPDKAAQVSVKAGVEYMKAGNYERAHHHFQNALDFDPKSSEAHNAIALLYQLTGDVKLEEEHLKKAVRYDGSAASARNNYGAFLFREGRYKAAIKQLAVAAENPSYDKRDSALLNMGRCALKLDDYELAENSFRRAIRLNSSLSRPYLELADIYFSQKKFKDANSFIKQYGKIARHTPRSLWLGIRVARIVGDKNGLASYELALKNLYPNSPEYTLYKDSIAE